MKKILGGLLVLIMVTGLCSAKMETRRTGISIFTNVPTDGITVSLNTIGILKTDPNNTYALDVNGKINCTEIFATTSNFTVVTINGAVLSEITATTANLTNLGLALNTRGFAITGDSNFDAGIVTANTITDGTAKLTAGSLSGILDATIVTINATEINVSTMIVTTLSATVTLNPTFIWRVQDSAGVTYDILLLK